MRIWSISDIGLVRHKNQDACQTMLIGEYTAAVVCDGMGGTAGGAVASHLAVQTYREHLEANLRSRMTMEQLKEVAGEGRRTPPSGAWAPRWWPPLYGEKTCS